MVLHEKTDTVSQNYQELLETKYPVPIHQRNYLLSILRHRTKIAEKYHFGRTRTVYFDDRQNSSYQDSYNGNIFKKKFRFREYLTQEEGAALYSLEVKIKSNIKTSKAKRLISRKLPDNYRFTTFRDLIDTFEHILDCSLSFIRRELPNTNLFPDAILYCSRYRFEDYEADIRYNLDTDVTMCSNTRQSKFHDHGISLNHDIFEVKGYSQEAFPEFLRNFDFQASAFSKFTWGKGRCRPSCYDHISASPQSSIVF